MTQAPPQPKAEPPAPGALDQPLDQVQEDPRVRQFLLVYLKEDEFRFEPGLPLDSLDLHSALRAQVRPTATADGTLPATVGQYVLMRMKDGTHFPAGIAHALPNGRNELLDARQRTEAAKQLNMTRLPFYVITSDDEEVLWKVALRANPDLNGVPPTEEDVEQQVLAYKAEFPNTPQVLVAALFKMNDKQVSKILSRAKVGERLESMGFKTQAAHEGDPEADVFTPNIVGKLSPIQFTPVLQAAATLIRDAKASNPMVATLVKEIGQQTSEADALAVIEAHRKNGWANRIHKVSNGAYELPSQEHPVRERLLKRAELLARDLSRYKTPASAEMTDAKAAQDFWGYIVAIEMSARRIVGPNAKVK